MLLTKATYPGAPLGKIDLQIAEELLRGFGDAEIAQHLSIKEENVKKRLQILFVKMWVLGPRSQYHKRIALAVALHRQRKELGIRCSCDAA